MKVLPWDSTFISKTGRIKEQDGNGFLLKIGRYKHWVCIDIYSMYTCLIEKFKELFYIDKLGIHSIDIKENGRKKKYIIRPYYKSIKFNIDQHHDLIPKVRTILLFKSLCFIANNNLNTIVVTSDDKVISIKEKSIKKDWELSITLMNIYFPTGNTNTHLIKCLKIKRKEITLIKIEDFFQSIYKTYILNDKQEKYLWLVRDNIVDRVNHLDTD